MNMNSAKLSSIYSRVNTVLCCRCFHQQNFLCRDVSRKVDSTDPRYLDGKIDDDTTSLSAYAHDYWWGQKNPLHALNHVRVPFIRNGILAAGVRTVVTGGTPSRLDGIKILDVGCGGGILSEALARIGADVTGIDIEKRMIEVAEQHRQLDPSLHDNLRYHHTTIFKHEKDNTEKYNAVVLSEVIEHVGHKEKLLRSCYNTLRPGGSLFITCPNRTTLSKIFGVTLAEALNIVPKGTHDFDKFITDKELTEMLKKLKLGIRNIEGIIYNPLTGKFSMTSMKTFMYAIHAQKVPDKLKQISW